MSEGQEPEVKQKPDLVAFSEFLESTPPSSITNVSSLTISTPHPHVFHLGTPDIQLHCPNDACNGTRFFRCVDKQGQRVGHNEFGCFYMSYVCSNCQETTKTFSLTAKKDSIKNSGMCYKFGEHPAYGPPTPSRLIKLIGPDREVFLQGRRCENQGLGIGAFAYYRRVVVNQKNRILDEIIKASKKLDVDDDIITTLEAAKTETRFSESLASVKHAIPPALLINGHNPLTMLHSALSDGLHDQSDEHCLETAIDVRVVLGELAERLAQVLKDEVELNKALKRLGEARNRT